MNEPPPGPRASIAPSETSHDLAAHPSVEDDDAPNILPGVHVVIALRDVVQ